MPKPPISIKEIGKSNFLFGLIAGALSSIVLAILTAYLQKFFFLMYWFDRIEMNAAYESIQRWPYIVSEYYHLAIAPYFNKEAHQISHLCFALVFTSIGFALASYIWITNKTYFNSRKRRKVKLYRATLYNTIWSFLQTLSRVAVVLGIFMYTKGELHHGNIALIFILATVYFVLLSITALRKFYRLSSWKLYFFIGFLILFAATYFASKQSYTTEVKALQNRIDLIEKEALKILEEHKQMRYDGEPPPHPPPTLEEKQFIEWVDAIKRDKIPDSLVYDEIIIRDFTGDGKNDFACTVWNKRNHKKGIWIMHNTPTEENFLLAANNETNSMADLSWVKYFTPIPKDEFHFGSVEEQMRYERKYGISIRRKKYLLGTAIFWDGEKYNWLEETQEWDKANYY